MNNLHFWPLEDSRFGFCGSSLFLGQRLARTESGAVLPQIYADLPRTEPRKTAYPEEWAPPDLVHHDSLKDKAGDDSWLSAPPGLLFLRPVRGEENLAFSASRSAGRLRLQAENAAVAVAFDGPACLRVRGRGCGLHFFAPLLDHEAAIPRLDGTFQVCFEASCEALFVPLRGSARLDNPWSLWHGGTEKLLLIVEPDDEGIFELAVHLVPSSAERFSNYRPFDDCVQEAESAFRRWLDAQPEAGEPSPESLDRWLALPPLSRADSLLREAENAANHFPRRTMSAPFSLDPPPDAILSSLGDYDLRSTEFSRRGSFLCLLENDEDRSLYLSVSRSPEMWAQRSCLIRLSPVLGGRELPFEYFAEPSRLVIRTYAGQVECCFDRDGRLRLRGTGVGLRLSFHMMLFENVCPLEDGCWEAAYQVLGRILFTPLAGTLYCNGVWSPSLCRADDFVLEFLPSTETGVFEGAAANALSTVPRPDRYDAFDACVADAAADFESFCTRFPAVRLEHAAMARLAAWVVWTHTVGPAGRLKHEIVYMTRIQWLRAFGWQQSFQAIAASRDIRAAYRLLLTIFDHQDPGGQLPDSVGDIGITYRVTKPALQGLAFLFLADRCDLSLVSQQEWFALYQPMCRFASWWLTFRDRSCSGLPQYYHSDESPGEWCDVFAGGLPIFSPDLVAFVALLAEACGRLAVLSGHPDQEQRWSEIASGLVSRMLSRLWDGDRFHSVRAATGEMLPSRCVLEILPVMLGSRLPQDALDKVIDHLFHDEGKDAFTPSPKSLFYNVLIAAGLLNAGRRDLACRVAEMSVDTILVSGFSMTGGRDPEKATESPQPAPSLPRTKTPAPVGKWTSWYAACFLILAGVLRESDGSSAP